MGRSDPRCHGGAYAQEFRLDGSRFLECTIETFTFHHPVLVELLLFLVIDVPRKSRWGVGRIPAGGSSAFFRTPKTRARRFFPVIPTHSQHLGGLILSLIMSYVFCDTNLRNCREETHAQGS